MAANVLFLVFQVWSSEFCKRVFLCLHTLTRFVFVFCVRSLDVYRFKYFQQRLESKIVVIVVLGFSCGRNIKDVQYICDDICGRLTFIEHYEYYF